MSILLDIFPNKIFKGMNATPMVPGERFDVVIIGAGIVGLTSAYYLKKNNPDLSVAVVDRTPTYAQGNTAKSAAGFRDTFSSELNFNLSNSTIKFYRHVQEDLGYDLGMNFVGYLFLMNEQDQRLKVLEEISSKTSVKIFNAEDLQAYDFLKTKLDADTKGLMNLKDIDVGILGENCGIIEPGYIADFYYNSALRLGVEFFFNVNVKEMKLDPVSPLDYPGEPFLWQKMKMKHIVSSKGIFEAETFIVAANVWTTGLLDPTGIDSHVRPKKRQVFQISGPTVESVLYGWDGNEGGIMPFTILPTYGIYMRPAPKEKSFWVGIADEYNRDFSLEEDPQSENSYYENSIAQVIQAYFPTLSYPKVTASWAGYYAYNTLDGAPYIFKNLNIIVATGTSGSGILKGDAIGRFVEAVYSGREYVELYNGSKLKTSIVGVSGRNIEKEKFII